MSLPSGRYRRLYNRKDLELHHTLQACSVDYSAFGLTAPSISCPTHDAECDALSALSPSPETSSQTEQMDSSHKKPQLAARLSIDHAFCLSPAVLNSLVGAALATRESIIEDHIPEAQKPSLSQVPMQRQCLTQAPSTSKHPSSHFRTAANYSPALAQKSGLPSQPTSSLNQQPSTTPSFQTARSRLLRSSLNVNRTSHDARQNYLSAGPTSSSIPTRNLLGPKRPRLHSQSNGGGLPQGSAGSVKQEESVDSDIPEVPNVDPKLVQMIMNETLEKSPGVDWDDIAGLTFAKQCVMEAVVWPMLRPDIFSGLRGPPKGLLLFGPPGTGKTMIGRAIASKSGARFFNISASSLVSKWAGEGEKTVRALFGVARIFQPSVVFIDEIDSLLTQRSDGEQEHSRRIKTEFLVQMDGAGTSRDDRVLVVGATNRPQELDEAARRRLVKRLYIPLPDTEARCALVTKLMQKQSHSLSAQDLKSVAQLSDGYLGSDMYALCAEAALGPVRDLGDAIQSIDAGSVRPVNMNDFRKASQMVRASVSLKELDGYVTWNESFGSFSIREQGQADTEMGGLSK